LLWRLPFFATGGLASSPNVGSLANSLFLRLPAPLAAPRFGADLVAGVALFVAVDDSGE
jgi:hypothetical protein